jgi:hypothetical protein
MNLICNANDCHGSSMLFFFSTAGRIFEQASELVTRKFLWLFISLPKYIRIAPFSGAFCADEDDAGFAEVLDLGAVGESELIGYLDNDDPVFEDDVTMYEGEVPGFKSLKDLS